MVETETTTPQEPSPKRRRVTPADGTTEDSTKPSKPKQDSSALTESKETIAPFSSTTRTTSSGSSKVYVGNLHLRVQQVHLEKLLQPYGTVVNIHVCYAKETGRPKGYAFCQFANARQASAAMAALHGRKLLGKSLVVQSAKPEGAATKTPASGKKTGSDSQKLADKIEKLKKALKNETT